MNTVYVLFILLTWEGGSVGPMPIHEYPSAAACEEVRALIARNEEPTVHVKRERYCEPRPRAY